MLPKPSASDTRTFGSTLTSADPSACSRSASPAMASQPGAVQEEIEPMCSASLCSGQAAATSASVHCQSAAPRTWKP